VVRCRAKRSLGGCPTRAAFLVSSTRLGWYCIGRSPSDGRVCGRSCVPSCAWDRGTYSAKPRSFLVAGRGYRFSRRHCYCTLSGLGQDYSNSFSHVQREQRGWCPVAPCASYALRQFRSSSYTTSKGKFEPRSPPDTKSSSSPATGKDSNEFGRWAWPASWPSASRARFSLSPT